MARRAAAPRSLADEMRSWDDARLVGLLRARPDLLAPVPPDLASLAARSTTRASVHRALDGLDSFSLQVLDVLAVLPEPSTRTDLARLLGLRPAAVSVALQGLRDLALVWGRDDALRLVLTVREALGPFPAGLGPATSAPLAAGSDLDDLLGSAPAGVSEVLERLTWGPPVGAFSRADRPADLDSTAPVEWLLARRLLTAADPSHVVLPREVGLHLRGGRVHAQVTTEPEPVPCVQHDPAAVDGAAGAAASEVLRLVGELGELWGRQPPPVLRAGGLGVRDLRRTAAALDVPEASAAFVIELAYVAGLVADDGEVGPSWLPTPAFDGWTAQAAQVRWALLARAWLMGSRVAGLVGSRDEKDSPRAALSADLERPVAAVVREDVLRELALLPAAAAPSREGLLERMRWRRPRRSGSLHDRLVTWTLAESELLGVTGRGALSSAGRALWEAAGPGGGGRRETVEGAVERLLPVPVDHVLLQADLTAVAPGPLEVEVGRLLNASADVESRGGATVYRFGAASVRRALDVGWSGEQLLADLAAASRTPVPQPLEYLVRDVARRHGRVRVGSASAYVRSDDETVLRELLADRRAAALQLRALAPTVLATAVDAATVLDVLRELGLAPAAESARGEVVVRRPDVRRTPPRQPPAPGRGRALAPADPLLEAVARALRSAARHTVDADDSGPRLTPSEPAATLATLREAVARRSAVWIGYADGNGRVERRVVEPLSVEGGRVTALDHASEQVRTFSVHRVTGVAPAVAPSP
jgi:hypothetical protein